MRSIKSVVGSRILKVAMRVPLCQRGGSPCEYPGSPGLTRTPRGRPARSGGSLFQLCITAGDHNVFLYRCVYSGQGICMDKVQVLSMFAAGMRPVEIKEILGETEQAIHNVLNRNLSGKEPPDFIIQPPPQPGVVNNLYVKTGALVVSKPGPFKGKVSTNSD